MSCNGLVLFVCDLTNGVIFCGCDYVMCDSQLTQVPRLIHISFGFVSFMVQIINFFLDSTPGMEHVLVDSDIS